MWITLGRFGSPPKGRGARVSVAGISSMELILGRRAVVGNGERALQVVSPTFKQGLSLVGKLKPMTMVLADFGLSI